MGEIAMIFTKEAGEVTRRHQKIVDAYKASLADATRNGEVLTHVKSKLPHGEFGPWVEANLPFDKRTAQNYMRVYRERDRLKNESVSHLGEAYKLLAAPKNESVSHLGRREVTVDGVNIRPKPGHALIFRCNRDELHIIPVDTESGEYYMITLVQLLPDGTYEAGGDTRGINAKNMHIGFGSRFPKYFLHGEREEVECLPWKYNPFLYDSQEHYDDSGSMRRCS